MLSRDEAKAFYDRFGAKQDAQGYYEKAAIDDLLAEGDFESAHSVYEFGCGTGALAERLLEHCLPLTSKYRGVDLSETMVALARERVRRFEHHAKIQLSDGSMRIDAPEESIDRVLSTYVLDLLCEEDVREFLREAQRVLTTDGLLCVAGLTRGTTLVSWVVSSIWSLIHRVRPALVGGCRPLRLMDFLDERDWAILHRRVVTPYGIPSETVIATPRPRLVSSASVAVDVA